MIFIVVCVPTEKMHPLYGIDFSPSLFKEMFTLAY